MALTRATVQFRAEVILKSCGKHDKHFTNVCTTCSEGSSFLQRQNYQAPKCLQLIIHNICMNRLLKPPVFPLFLYITNTHTPEHAHTYWTHTHIQCNSSDSSCSGVPSLVMSSYVWSFWLGALLLEEKKQQNWANVCLCPPWEGRAFLLPKYKSQDFGCILPGQREAMAERKIPIRHWSEPN